MPIPLPRYVELQATSHFSFLRGASSCEELFSQANVCGVEALAIVDRNSVAGIVRAWEAAKVTDVRLIVGCRLDLVDGAGLLVYPTDRAAWSRLTRLLSVGKRRAGKAKCNIDWTDVADWSDGLIAILVPDEADATTAAHLRKLRQIFADHAYLALTLRRRPGDALRLHDLSNLAAQAGVPTVVTNDVLLHHPKRRLLQDVATCVRHGCTIDELGFRRERHADRHLKPAEEMHRLFARYPEALARTLEIAGRCRFSLDELQYQYPDEVSTPGMTSLNLIRREALWAIKGLRDEPLPLFAAASLRERQTVPETDEPEVALKPMTAGREVVEDYGHVGLTLRDHPLAFLRADLARERYETCAEAGSARDLKFVRVAGVVLIRQKPGSAKGVMFITLEDESGIANRVVWPKLYEENRRIILSATMLGVHGRIQREGEVVHLVAYKLFDLSEQLASVGGRDAPFRPKTGRGDEFAYGGSRDQRDLTPRGMAARDIYIPDLHIDSIRPRTRNFR